MSFVRQFIVLLKRAGRIFLFSELVLEKKVVVVLHLNLSKYSTFI